MISIVKQDNLEAAYDTFRYNAILKAYKNPFEAHGSSKKFQQNPAIELNATLDSLASTCWNRIDRALDLGYESLLSRHTKSFSSKMNRVSLHGGPGPDTTSTSSSSSVVTPGFVCKMRVMCMLFDSFVLLLLVLPCLTFQL